MNVRSTMASSADSVRFMPGSLVPWFPDRNPDETNLMKFLWVTYHTREHHIFITSKRIHRTD